MTQTGRIRLGDKDIPYALRRSTRRTIGFVINRDGLSVTAPQRVSVRDIEAALQEKSHWILGKLAAWAERPHQRELAYVTGEILPWLGGELELQVEPRGIRTTLRRDGDRVLVTVDPEASGELRRRAIASALMRHYKREGEHFMRPRVEAFATRLERPVRKVVIRDQKRRWGSCAPDGTIRLNWRLMGFPENLVDYVCAHEAAHLVEHNHSPAFWKTVERIMPDWRIHRDEMRRAADLWTWV
ncbi:M48 family metallopeptidase [Maricaulis salignorans]|uniref:M48 family metallopeptidase n=1 Tax=Maricaulis salignorans TaxID=144026 RepID=UPI003A8E2943